MMRLLMATDGSPNSKRAAKLTAQLAKELRACEVVLVNAGHIPAIALGGPGADVMVDYGMLEEGFEKAGLAILEETKTAFHGLDVPVTTQYRRGEPSREILAAAAEVKANIIVMGSRGLGQIGGLILGSVSERVLHGANIPVLVVR
jgi:nucleotide-binding universal stress UspA family protein